MNADRSLDYLAIGHVTADVSASGSEALGGAVSYAASTAAALGLRAGIVTCAAEGFVAPSALPGVARRVVSAPATTAFENRYDSNGDRTQRLLALAPALRPSDVPRDWRRVGVLHVAPVVHEVGSEVVEVVEADLVGLAPQGWLRRLTVGQRVEPRPWAVPPALLAQADAVVLSTEDLAGDPGRVPWLAERVPVLVVTHGAEGAVAIAGGRELHQPASPAEPVDPTGAGDVFATAFFVRLWESGDVALALRFAAAAAALNIESRGIGGAPDRAAVIARSRLMP